MELRFVLRVSGTHIHLCKVIDRSVIVTFADHELDELVQSLRGYYCTKRQPTLQIVGTSSHGYFDSGSQANDAVEDIERKIRNYYVFPIDIDITTADPCFLESLPVKNVGIKEQEIKKVKAWIENRMRVKAVKTIQEAWREARLNPYCKLGFGTVNKFYDEYLNEAQRTK